MNYLLNSKNKIHQIFNIIEMKYKECNQISLHPNNNLIGLYFHEIMRYFCTSLVREEVRKKRHLKMTKFIDDEIRFGYRKNKTIYKTKTKINLKKIIISFISHILTFTNWPILYLGEISIDKYELISQAFLKKRRVFFLNKNSKVYIDNFHIQKKLLLSLIQTLCNFINIKFDKKLLNDIESSFSIITNNTNEIKKFNSNDVILIGTPAKIVNRVFSINGFFSDVKVICALHGDESGASIDYSWQYDDRSNCTHLLGYGKYGDFAYSQEKLYLSLNEKKYVYIESDSEIISSVYNKNEISKLNDFSQIHTQTGLYVSRRVNNISVINTYPLLDPIDYINWQKFLLEKFPNIFIKIHPKQSELINYNHSNIIYGNLSEILTNCEYDFFIIDNLSSTSFALIAATNKPIIYFNIEEPNLTIHAKKIIKERVLWIDIDIFNNFHGFSNYEKMSINNHFKNNYSTSFSLSSKNNISRVEAIMNEI